MKTIRIILWLIVLVVAASVAGVYVGQTFLAPESRSPAAGLASAIAHSQYEEAGGPFRLIDTAGEVVTADDLRGKPSAFFFGFTHCPRCAPPRSTTRPAGSTSSARMPTSCRSSS